MLQTNQFPHIFHRFIRSLPIIQERIKPRLRLPSFVKHPTLACKLALGFSVIVLIFSSVAVFTHFRMGEVKTSEAVVQQQQARQQTAADLKNTLQELDILAAGYMVSGNPELLEAYQKLVPKMNSLMEVVGATAETSDQRTWRARMTTVAGEYIGNFERVTSLVADESVAAERKRTLLSSAYTASQIHKQTIFDLVQSFADEYTAAAEAAKTETTELLRTTRTITTSAAAAAFLIAVIVTIIVIRSLTGGINKLRFAVEKMSIGDLTHTIQSDAKDELGVLSNRYDDSVIRMRELLGKAKRIAGALRKQSAHFRSFAQTTAEANGQIVRAMEEIAVGASDQAAHSEESASIIEELDGRLQNIGESADMLLQTSKEASKDAQAGSERAESLLKTAHRTSEAVGMMTSALQRLEEDSSHIAEITSTIQAISQQTNILSLNASIEAARAGAQGKGFSVIAEEIRKLSVQSEQSSRRISDLLSKLREGVGKVAGTLRSTSQSFDDQNVQVKQTNEAFTSIIGFIDAFEIQVQQIHSEIDHAKTQQHSIVHSVRLVNGIAQQTAAAVQQTAASANGQDETIGKVAAEADQMNHLAEALFTEINKFVIEDEPAGRANVKPLQ